MWGESKRGEGGKGEEGRGGKGKEREGKEGGMGKGGRNGGRQEFSDGLVSRQPLPLLSLPSNCNYAVLFEALIF